MHDYCCQQQQQHTSKEHLNGVGLLRLDLGVVWVLINDGPGSGRGQVINVPDTSLSLVGRALHIG